MRVAIASDHAGFDLKKELVEIFTTTLYDFVDLGVKSKEFSCDYPDFAHAVASYVSEPKSNFGILICGSGIGMSIVANRYSDIRAALCHNKLCAKLAREHNDANILCMGARFVNKSQAEKIVKIFLESKFDKIDRHLKRIQNINKAVD